MVNKYESNKTKTGPGLCIKLSIAVKLILFSGLLTYLVYEIYKILLDEEEYYRHPNLIHYWRFNNNLTKDIIGNKTVIKFKNASLIEDRNYAENSALRLKDGYLQLPEGVYVSKYFTITFQIRPTKKLDGKTIAIEFSNGTKVDAFYIGYEIGEIFKYIESDLNIIFTLKLNEWTYVAAAYSHSKIRIYINASFVGEIPHDSSKLPKDINRALNYIGKSSWNPQQETYADFDDVKIFNTNLNQNDVIIDYYGKTKNDKCPENWLAIFNRCFNFLDHLFSTVQEAERGCAETNATLISIKTDKEMEFFQSLYQAQELKLQLGARYSIANNNSFKWPDGTELSQNSKFWCKEEPKIIEKELCVQLEWNRFINDKETGCFVSHSCTVSHWCACEKPIL